jgi:hypothetical protein
LGIVGHGHRHGRARREVGRKPQATAFGNVFAAFSIIRFRDRIYRKREILGSSSWPGGVVASRARSGRARQYGMAIATTIVICAIHFLLSQKWIGLRQPAASPFLQGAPGLTNDYQPPYDVAF